jgi:amidohydrolase
MTPSRIDAIVEKLRPDLLELSRRVHATPELAFEEHQSSAWTAELLERNGFELARGIADLATAFAARWRGARDGPVVAFLGEYDALPDIGHGCGHNLMCSSSAGAAIATAQILGRDFAGEVRFIGTPAEEAGNGKVTLIDAGVFADVDAALQFHPNNRTSTEIQCMAVYEIGVDFHGMPAHPVANPWLGRNALDAIVTFYNSLSQWRQHFRPGQAIHGIITNGGTAPNIVPAETSGRFYLRTLVDEQLDELIDRFHTTAEAAAASTGCTVTFREAPGNRTRTMLNNPTLLTLCRTHLEQAGWEDGPVPPPLGSTDMTNVSQVVPTIHPYITSAPTGVPLHTREFAQWAGSETGEKALLVVARVLAGVALDLFENPRLVQTAWAELEQMRNPRKDSIQV